MRDELYFSCDVEADGPIPGVYSMSSIGLCLAGKLSGGGFTAIDPDTDAFYAELKPISDEFIPEAAAVSGLDREELKRSGEDPARAMSAASEWVRSAARAARARPVFVAYPLAFDWMFSHYYFERFAESTGSGASARDPFGFSGAIDIKSLYVARAGGGVGKATKRFMPKELTRSRFRHTHNALDDAKGQAELFQKIWNWRG